MLSNFISLLALIVSAYAAYKTVKFNQKQNALIATQEELSKLLLRRETNEALDSAKADLAVNFFKYGSGNYRLKIFNKGKSPARNVKIDFPDGNEMFDQRDISSKFPLEQLENTSPVELTASVSMDSPRKITVKLIWDDALKVGNEKSFYPTL